MSRSESLEGFVLAGGRSARMGRDKAFLNFGEKTFLENAVSILRPVCLTVSVVLNKSQEHHFAEKLPGGTSAVFDVFENRGAPGGIHCALTNCKSKLAVILACDLPFVTSEAVRKLAGVAFSSKEFAAIVPEQPDGRLQPLFAVYRVEKCLPTLGEILSKGGSVSVRDFLAAVKMKTVKSVDLSSDERIFKNINSLSDFEEIVQTTNPGSDDVKTRIGS